MKQSPSECYEVIISRTSLREPPRSLPWWSWLWRTPSPAWWIACWRLSRRAQPSPERRRGNVSVDQREVGGLTVLTVLTDEITVLSPPAARRAQLDRTRSRARLSTSGYLDCPGEQRLTPSRTPLIVLSPSLSSSS